MESFIQKDPKFLLGSSKAKTDPDRLAGKLKGQDSGSSRWGELRKRSTASLV